MKEAENRKLILNEVKKFKAIAGHGVEGEIKDYKVLLGNRKLMEKEKVDVSQSKGTIEKLEKEGKTVMIMSVNGNLSGFIAVADTVKESAKEAITALRRMNIASYMVTGDNERTAQAIAKQVGITQDHVLAEVLSQDKEKKVEELKRKGQLISFVGDGINDAPALAASDVGIAMGSGTDVAMEAAGVTLINKDLRSVATAIMLSKKTMRTIKLNLFWAFAYNIVLIPIAMMGKINPIFASAAMALSSISVVTNSLLLKKQKI